MVHCSNRQQDRGWPRGRRLIGAAALAWVAAGPGAAAASETDQFLTWGVELADSAEPLNHFVNHEFEVVLARLGRRGRLPPCEAVPGRLYRRVFSSIYWSRLRRFVQQQPEVEWYPRRGVTYWQYRSQSVFRKPVFPVLMPMARTLRVGDVYLGVDKLAHVFGEGRRYHASYQRARRRGLSAEEALRRTVVRGLHKERILFGGLVDGIVSHGDLEANYQGLRLAREMCEGPDPYLVRADGGWRLSRPIDLRDYVNPGFDESYNSNQYLAFRWRVVEPVLLAEYCPQLANERVKRRLARYREIDSESFSRRVIAEQYELKGYRSPRAFDLETVCAAQLPTAVAVAVAGKPGISHSTTRRDGR